MAAAFRRHDEYLLVHSLNVSLLALAQAQSLGLDRRLQADLGLAGLLHDAGKLAQAGALLRGRKKMSAAETEQMRLHPLDGAKILLRTPDLNPLVAAVAFEHHLRYDRTGYPRKMFGGNLNLASLIVAIADVYDALRSRRSYRAEMPPEAVHAEMQKISGTHLHPELLEAFFRTVGVFPPGTLVELDDGRAGIVVKANPLDVRAPAVEIWYAQKGSPAPKPELVDLAVVGPAIVRSATEADGYELPPQYRPTADT